MSKFIHYLKPYIPKMSLGLLIKFFGTIMDLLIPWILAHMIDDIVPLKKVSFIILWGIMMIICSLLAVITNIIANRMASKVASMVTENIRHDLFSKISYLSADQIDSYTVPSLISRLTSDTYNVHQMVGMMQRLGVRAPILLLGGIVVTLTLDPILTLVLLATLPFITIVVYYISKKGLILYKNLQKAVDDLVRTVRENITGIRVIKALSKTDYEKNRFSKVNKNVVNFEKKAGITMAITNPIMNLLLNLGLTFVIIVGAYGVNTGFTEPGKIIAFLTYFTIILNAMLSITRIFVLISKASASFQRISEVLDTPEDIIIKENDHIDSDYHISFDHVYFSYNKHQNTLMDINFNLKKGETLGIIGATGSGKSSIIKVLLRFYDIEKGSIRINGTNINSIPKDELYKKFGVAFQNDAIFANTIKENIDFGRNLSQDEITNAINSAQAEEFIKNLSDSFNHQLTVRGSNLSGGQKQRILLSRALAANPEILILDDSSSALDYKTDAFFRKSLFLLISIDV
jgi:ATP-binding cassette subfamily B protein